MTAPPETEQNENMKVPTNIMGLRTYKRSLVATCPKCGQARTFTAAELISHSVSGEMGSLIELLGRMRCHRCGTLGAEGETIPDLDGSGLGWPVDR